MHALLHIADSIEAMGPVWTYWAYPMERECGKIQRAAKGHRFAWASIDKVVLHQAQLDMVKLRYAGMSEELGLRDAATAEKGEHIGNCKSNDPMPASTQLTRRCADAEAKRLLLSQQKEPVVDRSDRELLARALALRFKCDAPVARRWLGLVTFDEWSGIRASDSGDRMYASKRWLPQADSRDACWVQVRLVLHAPDLSSD